MDFLSIRDSFRTYFRRGQSIGAIFLVVLLFALMNVACTAKNRDGVPSSDSHTLYTSLLKRANAERLEDGVRFHRPNIGENIALNSLILTDSESEMTLRFEPKTKRLPIEAIPELEMALPFGRFFVSFDTNYYRIVPQKTYLILRDISKRDVLAKFDILVESYFGSVQISTDSEIIAQILPGEPVIGSFAGDEIEKVENGFIVYKEGSLSSQLLGLRMALETTPTTEGVAATLHLLVKDSRAHRAGLLPGDLIIKVDGKPFNNLDEFFELLQEAKCRNCISFIVMRNSTMSDHVVLLPYDQ